MFLIHVNREKIKLLFLYPIRLLLLFYKLDIVLLNVLTIILPVAMIAMYLNPDIYVVDHIATLVKSACRFDKHMRFILHVTQVMGILNSRKMESKVVEKHWCFLLLR